MIRNKQENIIPKRQLRDTFSVIVDGECEAWYLTMLKRNEPSVRISIDPEIPTKKRLSDLFKLVKQKAKSYTKVFWIVDLDVIIKETKEAKRGTQTPMDEFLEYQNILEENHKNVVVIVNNPCFEFWFLLHFQATSKIFKNYQILMKDLRVYLENYGKSERYYTKPNRDIWLRLKSHLQTAYNNAKKLGGFDENNPTKALAEMWVLFEEDAFKGLVEIKSK